MERIHSEDILKVAPKVDTATMSSTEYYNEINNLRKSDDLRSAENEENYVKVSFKGNVVPRGKNAH